MNKARNFIVFTWHRTGRHWVQRDRYETIHEAVASRVGRAVVIDLACKRTVWNGFEYCNRKIPQGIHCLPALEVVTETMHRHIQCCPNEDRDMNGGCRSCGAPCL